MQQVEATLVSLQIFIREIVESRFTAPQLPPLAYRIGHRGKRPMQDGEQEPDDREVLSRQLTGDFPNL